MSTPWMPLYVADYLADTSHLTTLQHGAYILLIMHYWRRGGLPDDDDQLARIVRMTPQEWKSNALALQKLFESNWKHKRIDHELATAEEKHQRRVYAGKQGGRPKQCLSNAKALPNQPQPQPHKKEREEDTSDGADAPSSVVRFPEERGQPSKYAFECGIIKLNQKDFDQWTLSFSHLDLRAELIALAEWAATLPKSKWFHAVAGALAKRNREQKTKVSTPAVASNRHPGGWI